MCVDIRGTIRRAGAWVALAGAAGVVPAQTVDLVDHNGFEACWSQALTKPEFWI